MKACMLLVAGLCLAEGLNTGRLIRQSREESVDQVLRAPRSPQVDEVLDPSIEDQLAIESSPIRHTIQVLAVPQPRYLEDRITNSLSERPKPIAHASSLGVYVGGGRRRARHAQPANKKEDDMQDDIQDQVETVSLDAVKIRPHGRYGALRKPRPAHPEIVGSRAVFEKGYGSGSPVVVGGRLAKRMSGDFIPFSEYDDRRVKTLKLEQNDFLALPIRLRTMEQIEEMLRGREKRKFPAGELSEES